MSQRQIETSTWRWQHFTPLSSEAKLLYVYLVTGPQSHVVGLSPLDDKEAQHHTGLDPDVYIDAKLELVARRVAAFSTGWSLTMHTYRNRASSPGWILAGLFAELEKAPQDLVDLFMETNQRLLSDQVERYRTENPDFHARLSYSIKKARVNSIQFNSMQEGERDRERGTDAPGSRIIDERQAGRPVTPYQDTVDQEIKRQALQDMEKALDQTPPCQAIINQVLADYPKRPRCRPGTGPDAYRSAAAALPMTGRQFRDAVEAYTRTVTTPKYMTYLDRLVTAGTLAEFLPAPAKATDPALARQVKERLAELDREAAERFKTKKNDNSLFQAMKELVK